MMALADRLHKTQGEIEELTLSELNEWFAYYKVIEDGRSKP
jgi:acetyl-CoA acetyltransferase